MKWKDKKGQEKEKEKKRRKKRNEKEGKNIKARGKGEEKGMQDDESWKGQNGVRQKRVVRRKEIQLEYKEADKKDSKGARRQQGCMRVV